MRFAQHGEEGKIGALQGQLQRKGVQDDDARDDSVLAGSVKGVWVGLYLAGRHFAGSLDKRQEPGRRGLGLGIEDALEGVDYVVNREGSAVVKNNVLAKMQGDDEAIL